MDTQTRAAVQKVEDLHRLADQGEQRGIRILVTEDGAHFVTSHTNGALLHRVSEQGCDCKGFTYWGRCTHHSLLLSELGALPDLEQDVLLDEQHSTRCRVCRGEGYIRAYAGGGLADWVASPCPGCGQHAA